MQLLYNISSTNVNCKSVADYINAILLLNTLQYLVLEEVYNYVIKNKRKLYITKKDQLLLYVRRKKGIKKIHIIHALEIEFSLLNRRNELML